ncbi:MAG: hypothetical protein JST00_26515 [Deltaproteobacteria bacterium]|nr:hypothetical protein [Deltaproteobacteria bacterium]
MSRVDCVKANASAEHIRHEPMKRTLLRGLRAAALPFVGTMLAILSPHDAGASTSIALSVRELAASSESIVRVTQLERSSAWVDGRIVTTTRARVDRVVAGVATGPEITIRTLGGVVGEIGQRVEGEAELGAGEQALLFVAPLRGQAAMSVVGRAQGRWSIVRDAHAREVVRVRDQGRLVERRGDVGVGVRAPSRLAAALDGSAVDEATAEAVREWGASHAR